MKNHITHYDPPRRIAVQYKRIGMLFYDNIKLIILDKDGHFLKLVDDNDQEVVMNFWEVTYFRTDD